METILQTDITAFEVCPWESSQVELWCRLIEVLFTVTFGLKSSLLVLGQGAATSGLTRPRRGHTRPGRGLTRPHAASRSLARPQVARARPLAVSRSQGAASRGRGPTLIGHRTTYTVSSRKYAPPFWTLLLDKSGEAAFARIFSSSRAYAPSRRSS